MDNIIYKIADKNDLDEIIKLGGLLVEFEITETEKSFWDKSVLENCINNPNAGLILCSYCEKDLAGFMIVQTNHIFKVAFIDYIFVLPKFRSLNIGKGLYNLAIQELEKAPIETLSISVEYNNNSIIEFFQARGFEKTLNMANLDLKLK